MSTPPHDPAAVTAPTRRLVVAWDSVSEHPGALAYQECRTATVSFSVNPLTDTPASQRHATILLLVEVLREDNAQLIADHLQHSILPLLLIDDQALGLSLAELAMRGLAERFPQASASLACIAPQRSTLAFCGGNRHALFRHGSANVLRSGESGNIGVIPLELGIDDWLFILARSTKDVIPSGTSLSLARQTGSVKAACQALVRQAQAADHLSHHAAMGAHLMAIANPTTVPATVNTETNTAPPSSPASEETTPNVLQPTVRRTAPRRFSQRR